MSSKQWLQQLPKVQKQAAKPNRLEFRIHKCSACTKIRVEIAAATPAGTPSEVARRISSRVAWETTVHYDCIL